MRKNIPTKICFWRLSLDSFSTSTKGLRQTKDIILAGENLIVALSEYYIKNMRIRPYLITQTDECLSAILPSSKLHSADTHPVWTYKKI